MATTRAGGAWSGADGPIERARLATHRVAMPGVAFVLAAAFAFSASQGFPDRVEAAATPVLAILFAFAGVRAWLVGTPSTAWERVLLGLSLVTLLAAAFESAFSGRFEVGYPYLLGYAPLGYATAFLLLGPRIGRRVATGTYLGLAVATVAGTITGQIPPVRVVPLVLAHPVLIGLLNLVAWSIDVAARERHLALEQASVDPLTGALNRRAGERYLERQRERYALLVVDVDAFKAVNDAFGHAFGDRVLKSVVDGLRSGLRPDDLVVRWGGDEFVIIAPGATQEVADRLAARVAVEVQDRGRAMNAPIGASVGVAVRADEESWRSVFERADRAMYRTKHDERVAGGG